MNSLPREAFSATWLTIWGKENSSSLCLTADASDNMQGLANAAVTPPPQKGGEKQENHNERNTTNYSRYRQEDLALSLHSITSLQQRCPSPWIISPNLQNLFSLAKEIRVLASEKQPYLAGTADLVWQRKVSGFLPLKIPWVVTTKSF